MDDEARDTIERFHEAFNRRDLDALGDLITDDCVFEATSPAPDGTRHVGREAVLKAWRVFFTDSPASHVEVEEMFGAADRVIVRWLYSWADGHVRGLPIPLLGVAVIAAFNVLFWLPIRGESSRA
jgi:ketosteroid isomerase-like protein